MVRLDWPKARGFGGVRPVLQEQGKGPLFKVTF
jgi:hypothetical protein